MHGNSPVLKLKTTPISFRVCFANILEIFDYSMININIKNHEYLFNTRHKRLERVIREGTRDLSSLT